MKRTSIVSVVAVLVMASMASGATVWNPAGNGITPPATGNWNDAANWTNDVPGAVDSKAVFNVPDAAEAVVTDAQSFNQLVQGDNNVGGVIRVQDGGSISTLSGWTAIGYNNSAQLIVETGGTFSFAEHAWIGFKDGANGVVDINGGTVNVAGMLGLGWSGGDGYVNVNDGGLLALANIHGDGATSIKQASLLDITGTGQVTLPGDFEGVIATYAANGLIAGNGVLGAVQTDLTTNLGFTTVTVIPEPSTMLLVGLGLGGLLIRKRR